MLHSSIQISKMQIQTIHITQNHINTLKEYIMPKMAPQKSHKEDLFHFPYTLIKHQI